MIKKVLYKWIAFLNGILCLTFLITAFHAAIENNKTSLILFGLLTGYCQLNFFFFGLKSEGKI